MSRSRKQQKSIWTPANIVTTIRMVFIPIWIWAAEMATPVIGEGWSWPAFGAAAFYGALALTDKLDNQQNSGNEDFEVKQKSS